MHDGSENFNDTVKFEFEFLVDRDQPLPQYLRGRHSFMLNIDISPVDDAPLLIIPENKTFSLAQVNIFFKLYIFARQSLFLFY